MAKVHQIPKHVCTCGYFTFDARNAGKHAKAKCGGTLATTRVAMMEVADIEAAKINNTTVDGDNNNIQAGDHNTINQITINLLVPPGEMRDDMLRALRHPEVLQRLPHTPPEEITALLFQYARGADAPASILSRVGTEIHPGTS
jgi:hypothetical protein